MNVTLHLGQPVPWRAAPAGIAQISELRRVRVELCYVRITGRGPRLCRVLVPASHVARLVTDQPLLFPVHNPYRRADVRRERTYTVNETQEQTCLPIPQTQIPID